MLAPEKFEETEPVREEGRRVTGFCERVSEGKASVFCLLLEAEASLREASKERGRESGSILSYLAFIHWRHRQKDKSEAEETRLVFGPRMSKTTLRKGKQDDKFSLAIRDIQASQVLKP